MMDQLNLNAWQMIAAGILYIAYLCWVMFGGMRKKKIKPVVYIVMTILMFYGLLKEYDGIHSAIEVIDICLILLIGFVKGIYLGKRKIVEYIDDRWYMRHDKKYILAWVLFFAVKLLIAQILKLVTGSAMPFWHMILYFCFYYPWRTINVFIANPDMRKAVLKKK